MWTPFIFLASMGFGAGFSHCIGMCGVFVVAYSGIGRGEGQLRPPLLRHAMFHSGRLAALALLGIIGGVSGQLTHSIAHGSGLFGIVAGFVMLLLASGFGGLLPHLRLPEPDVLSWGNGTIRRVYVSILRSDNTLKPLAIGTVVGLLPCGFTYSALIASINSRNILTGILLMLTFGLASMPGLLALGIAGNTFLGGRLLNARFRAQVTRFSAYIMLATALYTIYEGYKLL